MLRRLLLIGDVHTEATRLARVLDHAARTRPDAVLCVGDIVDGPEDATRCIELLREHEVATVRGNHERWLLGGRPLEPFDGPGWAHAWLAALPTTRSFQTVAGALLLGHALGDDDMTRLQADDTGYALENNEALWRIVRAGTHRWLVGGHTHRRMIRRFEDLTVLNPGTLARRDGASCLEVDLEAGRARWHRVDLDGLVPDGELDLP